MNEPLHDRFGRPVHDLRISVTDTCNFRCPYCMPAEIYGDDYLFLRKEELLTFEEIARLARIFASLGVVKLRLTGGEPLLRPWLHDLIRMVKRIEGIEDIALITNGLLLEKLAAPLHEAGLDRLRTHFAAKMKAGPDASAFTVVTQRIDTQGVAFRDVAGKIASIDTLESFMKDFKERYGSAPATN